MEGVSGGAVQCFGKSVRTLPDSPVGNHRSS